MYFPVAEQLIEEKNPMVQKIPEISVEELKTKLENGENVFLLDVRENDEYLLANLGGHLIPLRELPARLQELDPLHEIVAYCHTGRRSALAVNFLRTSGFSNVKNLVGGIDAWAARIDPSMNRY